MSAVHKMATSFTSGVEWLDADSLEVTPEAQRKFDPAWAARLARDFDPDAVGVPCVAEIKQGKTVKRYILDGQHRVHALREALGAGQMIQCEVIRAVTLQRAARIFVLRNTQRSVRAIDVFVNNVRGGEPESVAINRIVESFGLRVDDSKTDTSVKCVSALQRIYRGDAARGMGKNELTLKRALTTALQAWGRSRDSMNGDVLYGIGLVILKHGDTLEFEALERKLAQFPKGPVGLIGKARGSRETMGGSLAQNMASVIVREYNKGRRKHQLPEWFTAA
jgi:hypothetical protein